MVASNQRVSSRYRDERRVPAKDENGNDMCDLSPYAPAVSPVVAVKFGALTTRQHCALTSMQATFGRVTST
jgi:hypothetical protein